MAARTSSGDSLEALKRLVGKWRMVAVFKGMPPADLGAHVTFEWLPGQRFLIQRCKVLPPEAPAGIAISGPDLEHEGKDLQHSFDTRGVARVYKMSFERGVWKLWRDEADFSPLDFYQRSMGGTGDDGKTFAGAWEISHDGIT